MARPRKSQPATTTTAISSSVTTSASVPASATTTTTTSSAAAAGVRARRKPQTRSVDNKDEAPRGAAGSDTSPAVVGEDADADAGMPSWAARNRWVVFAIASGACAACNGVFAKLTTNELSTHIAQAISRLFQLTDLERYVEIVVRCGFFGLNLAFNGVMWALFTRALAKGNSTTQVSIMNTSTNFVVTAILGFAIFAEALPPLWWVGAALLVAGNVIIGRGNQEQGSDGDGDDGVGETEPLVGPYRADVEHGSGGGGGSDDGDDHDESAVDLGMATDASSYADSVGGSVVPVEKDEDEDVALLGDLS